MLVGCRACAPYSGAEAGTFDEKRYPTQDLDKISVCTQRGMGHESHLRQMRTHKGLWTMSAETEIRQRLMVGLEPTRLDVVNESHLHAGHRDAPGTGDSHFRVLVVSAKFVGMSRIARHRLVTDIMADLMNKPIHALALKTYAPGEAVG